MRIERCLCHDTSFSELLKRADSESLTSEDELLGLDVHGGGCGLCRPYVRRMLRTRQTSFGEVITDRDEPLADGA